MALTINGVAGDLGIVEIGPGYGINGLGIVEVEPGYGINGYDDVQLVGANYDGVSLMGYDDVQLVGAFGEGEPWYKNYKILGAIAAGVAAIGAGVYYLRR